jgi:hypothetical protein
MRRRILGLFVLSVLTIVPIGARQTTPKAAAPPAPAAAVAQKAEAAPVAPAAPRPMELADIIAWKNVGATAISPNGRWFACGT